MSHHGQGHMHPRPLGDLYWLLISNLPRGNTWQVIKDEMRPVNPNPCDVQDPIFPSNGEGGFSWTFVQGLQTARATSQLLSSVGLWGQSLTVHVFDIQQRAKLLFCTCSTHPGLHNMNAGGYEFLSSRITRIFMSVEYWQKWLPQVKGDRSVTDDVIAIPIIYADTNGETSPVSDGSLGDPFDQSSIDDSSILFFGVKDSVSTDDLERFLLPIGSSRCRIQRSAKKCKGKAIATFSTPAQARAAGKFINGRTMHGATLSLGKQGREVPPERPLIVNGSGTNGLAGSSSSSHLQQM